MEEKINKSSQPVLTLGSKVESCTVYYYDSVNQFKTNCEWNYSSFSSLNTLFPTFFSISSNWEKRVSFCFCKTNTATGRESKCSGTQSQSTSWISKGQ